MIYLRDPDVGSGTVPYIARKLVELALWRVGLRRLSLWAHRKNEPLFYFQIPKSKL